MIKRFRSPTICFDHYEGKAGVSPQVQMRSERTTRSATSRWTSPAGLSGDELRKWAYQYYIKDYLRCVQSVDDNVGRVLDYLDAGRAGGRTRSSSIRRTRASSSAITDFSTSG